MSHILHSLKSYSLEQIYPMSSAQVTDVRSVVQSPSFLIHQICQMFQHESSYRNSPVTGEYPIQRPVTSSFDAFFDLRLNQPLGNQWRRWWFKTPSRSLWRHCGGDNRDTAPVLKEQYEALSNYKLQQNTTKREPCKYFPVLIYTGLSNLSYNEPQLTE